jgi:hypothetical protein
MKTHTTNSKHLSVLYTTRVMHCSLENRVVDHVSYDEKLLTRKICLEEAHFHIIIGTDTNLIEDAFLFLLAVRLRFCDEVRSTNHVSRS